MGYPYTFSGVQTASANAHKTPLAEQLDKFSSQMSKLVSFICLFVWAVNIPKFGSKAFGSWIQGAFYFAKGHFHSMLFLVFLSSVF